VRISDNWVKEIFEVFRFPWYWTCNWPCMPHKLPHSCSHWSGLMEQVVVLTPSGNWSTTYP